MNYGIPGLRNVIPILFEIFYKYILNPNPSHEATSINIPIFRYFPDTARVTIKLITFSITSSLRVIHLYNNLLITFSQIDPLNKMHTSLFHVFRGVYVCSMYRVFLKVYHRKGGI